MKKILLLTVLTLLLGACSSSTPSTPSANSALRGAGTISSYNQGAGTIRVVAGESLATTFNIGQAAFQLKVR